MTNAAVQNMRLFTVPEGYRPNTPIFFPAYSTSNSGFVLCYINGESFVLATGTINANTYLDGSVTYMI